MRKRYRYDGIRTCPDCGHRQTVVVNTPGKNITRRCRTCMGRHLHRNLPVPPEPMAKMTRVCLDCGDVRRLRPPGRDLAGATIKRRCQSCQGKMIHRMSPGFVPTARDDIDDVAVDRLMGGGPVRANIAERLEATAVLADVYRLPERIIAGRLKVSKRTVQRYKRELRDTGRLAA